MGRFSGCLAEGFYMVENESFAAEPTSNRLVQKYEG
jgi:hypothetical protein